MLRVAFYSPALPDSGVSNGIVTYVRIMRDALRGLGHRVMVVTPDRAELFDHGVVDIPQPSRFRLTRDWGTAQALNAFRFAKQRGAQIFEIEESFGWSGLLKGIPIVTRLHGPNGLSGEPHSARETAEIAALRKARFVTSPTHDLLDALAAKYGLDFPNARVIPNPMPELHPRWSLENADPDQILFVGRMDYRKGADIALKAFSLAREQKPSLKLVMAGPGDAPNDIPEGVTILGNQSRERIAELRLGSALQLHTSRFENFPYSVAEAMAMGLPVLMSDTFARSMICDQIEGRIVPIGDANATAKAVLEMFSDLERFSFPAIERVRTLMSPGLIAEETAAVYSQLVVPVGGVYVKAEPPKLAVIAPGATLSVPAA